jgi:hypothetical protein
MASTTKEIKISVHCFKHKRTRKIFAKKGEGETKIVKLPKK